MHLFWIDEIGRHSHLRFALILLWTGLLASTSHGQALPACAQRPTYLSNPWVDGTRWCLERVIDDEATGRLGFSALAAAPDGTLYATRPLTGELVALRDRDGDGIPETPTLAASGMTLPNGLVYHDETLYLSGGAHLYRFREGVLETLVDDLPAGTGYWTGGVAVGADERLYVATSAPCSTCPPDGERGAVLSFSLDGQDRRLVATGLHHPADLVAAGDALWVIDSTPDSAELHRLAEGADYTAAPPAWAFPPGANPRGIAYYDSPTFPALAGSLLVTLWGSENLPEMQGYALAAVHPNAADTPDSDSILIPNTAPGGEQFSLQQMNYRYSGFWPRRPLDVAVSAEGWVYISVGDGSLVVLRPL